MSTIRQSAHDVQPPGLGDATLEAALLFALTLDEEEPAVGIVLGVRRELALITDMLERSPSGATLPEDFAPVLEGIARRLDVGIELLRRDIANREGTRGDDQG